MNVRYQVFISSTFTDLKEERQKIMQSLMEMDCIPAGMEFFGAIDDEQFDFIKKIIDESDYYVLVVGGRYGTVGYDGISFTEKEFDYAINKGIKVCVFLHGDTESLTLEKSEKVPDSIKKLKQFREKVKTAGSNSRMVNYYTNSDELSAKVITSLTRTIRMFPATGWVRAGQTSSNDVLDQMVRLQKENENFQMQIREIEATRSGSEMISNLVSLEENFEVNGFMLTKENFMDNQPKRVEWKYKLPWKEFLKLIFEQLEVGSSEKEIRKTLARVLSNWSFSNEDNLIVSDSFMYDNSFNILKQQFRAKNIISIDFSNNYKYWSLTENGDRIMLSIFTVKEETDVSLEIT